MSPYSLVTSFPVTILSPLGAKPQPPGPNALFNIRLYLISGKYMIPSGFTSTSSCVMGASSVSDCSGVKDMLPRPWYERVQSMAGTPSSSGGASDSPSVSERCFWAADAAVSAVLLRVVGTGGSFAGNEGVTVRCGVAEVVGFDAVDVEVAGFAAVEVLVVVAAAALGAVAYAAQMRDEEKLRFCVRLAIDDALDDEAEKRAERPLRAGVAAIIEAQGCAGFDLLLLTDLDAPTRSHDLIGARARPSYANAIASSSPHQNPSWSRSHYTLRTIAFFDQSHQLPVALRLSPYPPLVFAFELDASVPFARSHTSNANLLHRIWSPDTTRPWCLPERARVCELG